MNTINYWTESLDRYKQKTLPKLDIRKVMHEGIPLINKIDILGYESNEKH